MHAMIDLETMGTAYNAPIIAIGAAVFDPIGGKIQGDFYAGIALDDALAHGVLKGDTLAWWMKQSDVARMHAISGTMPLREALLTFTAFFRSHVGEEVWGNGATFDITIMEHAYHACGLPAPWKFYDVRDCRTIKALAERRGWQMPQRPATNIHHQAKDDAIFQAHWVIDCHRVLLEPAAPPKARPAEEWD